jgi:NitT/TauT family transport system permease protein
MTSIAPSVRPRSRSTRWSWQALLVIAIVLLGWEAVIRLGWYSGLFIPAPSSVVRSLAGSIASGSLVPHLSATLLRVGAGLLIGGGLGLCLGLAMGWWAPLRTTIDPIIAAVHPIPKLTLFPLFIVLLGIGESSKVMVVAAASFFPMVINTMAGVRQISPIYFDVARNYGASSAQVFRRVLLPGSLPLILSGVRLAANVAFLSTVAVEMVMAQQGLGSLVWLAWQVLRVEQLYATLVVISVLGVGLNATLNWLAHRGAPWLADQQAAT